MLDGALRWQAPELIDGASSGQLTRQTDIYAFAIVCVEVLTHGALPWPQMDDDTLRHVVLSKSKFNRPRDLIVHWSQLNSNFVLFSYRSLHVSVMPADENRRPVVPSTNVSVGLIAIIQSAWDRDPAARPSASDIVRDLRKMRGTTWESPLPPTLKELWENQGTQTKLSPDLRPSAPLPGKLFFILLWMLSL